MTRKCTRQYGQRPRFAFKGKRLNGAASESATYMALRNRVRIRQPYAVGNARRRFRLLRYLTRACGFLPIDAAVEALDDPSSASDDAAPQHDGNRDRCKQ